MLLSAGGKTTAEDVLSGVDLTGKNCIVTGPNSGIGLETARALANHGARVFLPCRSLDKAEAAKKDIERTKPDALLTPMVLDLNDVDSVRAFAAQIDVPVHILVCNAGVMATPPGTVTKQGFEAQVGVNHLAHFLLVNLLLPRLKEAGGARVVAVSSMGHRLIKTPDWISSPRLSTPEYDPWYALGLP